MGSIPGGGIFSVRRYQADTPENQLEKAGVSVDGIVGKVVGGCWLGTRGVFVGSKVGLRLS